jgi:CRISPR/Cas system CSM-associated protein Csm3 (group 7 of RAMP superfamily)
VAEETQADLLLRLDASNDALKALAELIFDWRPSLGGGRSTGSGNAQVRSIKIGSIDLNTESGLTTWLDQAEKVTDITSARAFVESIADQEVLPSVTSVLAAAETPRIAEVEFSLPEGIRIRNGSQERNINEGAPPKQLAEHGKAIFVQIGDGYVVPGTTWKGVVRSRFEYILRSAADAYAKQTGKNSKVYRDKLACTDRSKCARKSTTETDPKPEPGCLTCWVFGSEKRSAEVEFSNSKIEEAKVALRTRVAIDRFTSGARDSALFPDTRLAGTTATPTTRLIINKAKGKPGDLLGETNSSNSDVDQVIRKVFALVLQDICDGLIGIGSRTAGGLGTLEFQSQTAWPLPIGASCNSGLPQVLPLKQDEIEALCQAADWSLGLADSAEKTSSDSSEASAKTQKTQDKPKKVPSQDLELREGRLISHGLVDWPTARALTDGMQAVWFDLDGPSIGKELPPKAPTGATHLWAWSEQRLLRFRIEDEMAIVAELLLDGNQAQQTQQGEVVSYRNCRNAMTYSPDDGRPGREYEEKSQVLKEPTVYTIESAIPLEFIQLTAN